MNHSSPVNLQETLSTHGTREPISPSYASVAQEEETDGSKLSPFTPLPALVHVVEESHWDGATIKPEKRGLKTNCRDSWEDVLI